MIKNEAVTVYITLFTKNKFKIDQELKSTNSNYKTFRKMRSKYSCLRFGNGFSSRYFSLFLFIRQ